MQVPRQRSYWPPEWQEQEAVWLSWPHRPELWSGHYREVEERFCELLLRLSRYVRVRCLARDASRKRNYQQKIEARATEISGTRTDRIEFPIIASDDVWMRDYAPLWAFPLPNKDRGPSESCKTDAVLLDFRFNAWGEKHSPYQADDLAGQRIAEWTGLERIPIDYVLEGGAIETNGSTLLASSNSILSPSRGLPISRVQFEKEMHDLLGMESVVWLDGVLPGDDTDGHVDMLARFCDPTSLLYCDCASSHPACQEIKKNYERLKSTWAGTNSTRSLIPLPLPRRLLHKGSALPRSYANFLIANGAVFVPIYGEPEDQEAVDIIAQAFPGYSIEAVFAGELILEGGAIHCLTMPEFRSPFGGSAR